VERGGGFRGVNRTLSPGARKESGGRTLDPAFAKRLVQPALVDPETVPRERLDLLPRPARLALAVLAKELLDDGNERPEAAGKVEVVSLSRGRLEVLFERVPEVRAWVVLAGRKGEIEVVVEEEGGERAPEKR
jgi:hypothetical protein